MSNQRLIKFKKGERRENVKDKMLVKQQKNTEIDHSDSLILSEKKLRIKWTVKEKANELFSGKPFPQSWIILGQRQYLEHKQPAFQVRLWDIKSLTTLFYV